MRKPSPVWDKVMGRLVTVDCSDGDGNSLYDLQAGGWKSRRGKLPRSTCGMTKVGGAYLLGKNTLHTCGLHTWKRKIRKTIVVGHRGNGGTLGLSKQWRSAGLVGCISEYV